MPRNLLDVNVIIALIDPNHVFHDSVHKWWEANLADGWASCPLTENGVIRIMSQPNYSKQARFSPGELIRILQEFIQNTDHEFWSDDVSLLNETIFNHSLITGYRQITDAYLLALAVIRQGVLTTFDKAITPGIVHHASGRHIAYV